MTPLAKKLKAKILATGPIPFSEYMTACLFDPEFGYYTNLQAIGTKGDFVTAPECGPYFAKAIAHFLEPQLEQFNQPVILELGGGSGQLAFDLLNQLQTSVRYLILEKSPSLKILQQDKLQRFVNVEWLETVPETNLEGVILANEFFDALPVERFVETEFGFEMTKVDYQNDEFVETGEGLRVEKCLLFKNVFEPILKCFSRGLALIIDYGAERVQRSTLTAYHQHQIVSAFDKPGDVDITTHVDFTNIAEVLLAQNWQIEFLKPQGQFLLEQAIIPAEGIETVDYALKRLVDPQLMGDLFKVLYAIKLR